MHTREDECFDVLDGPITVRCGGDVLEAGPRSFVFLPRGIPHAWDVVGRGVATVLIAAVPLGILGARIFTSSRKGLGLGCR